MPATALPLLLAPLLFAAGPAAHLEAAVRGEARVRSWQAEGGDLQPALDFEIDPRASARLTWRTAELAAAYAPRLTVPTTGGSLVRLLHQADLSLEGRPSPGLRLHLTERAAYGETDLSPVAQAALDPAAPLQTLPADVRTVRYLSSQTTAGLDAALTRQVQLALSAGWLVSGGADREAQDAAMPLQRGPLAEVSLTLAATRVDALQTRLYGSSALFTTGLRATLAGLEESWTRALSPSWGLRLSAGVGVADVRGGATPEPPPGPQWLPVGEAALAYKPLGTTGDLQGGLGVRAAPVVDRITGEAYERIDARLAAGWAPRRELRLAAQAGAGVVASGARAGNTVALLEASATLATGPDWGVSLGVRAAHQTLPANFDEFGAFLAFAALAQERL